MDDNFESEFYGKRRVKLLKAIDRIKDQTFFLSQVSDFVFDFLNIFEDFRFCFPNRPNFKF
jgi:hypothetical protein